MNISFGSKQAKRSILIESDMKTVNPPTLAFTKKIEIIDFYPVRIFEDTINLRNALLGENKMNVEQQQTVKDIIEIAKMVNDAGYMADKDYFAEIVFRDAVRAYFATKYHTSNFDNIKIEL